MLLSQYFYNKGYVTSWNWFLSGLTTDITFYLSLTTCHLNFIVNFLWKCLISSTTLKIFNIIKKQKMFQLFGPSFKIIIIKINLLSRTLDYFGVDSGIKMFFPTLFFFISKKKKHTTITTNKSVSTSVILPHSLFYVFLIFLFVWSISLRSKYFQAQIILVLLD